MSDEVLHRIARIAREAYLTLGHYRFSAGQIARDADISFTQALDGLLYLSASKPRKFDERATLVCGNGHDVFSGTLEAVDGHLAKCSECDDDGAWDRNEYSVDLIFSLSDSWRRELGDPKAPGRDRAPERAKPDSLTVDQMSAALEMREKILSQEADKNDVEEPAPSIFGKIWRGFREFGALLGDLGKATGLLALAGVGGLGICVTVTQPDTTDVEETTNTGDVRHISDVGRLNSADAGHADAPDVESE